MGSAASITVDRRLHHEFSARMEMKRTTDCRLNVFLKEVREGCAPALGAAAGCAWGAALLVCVVVVVVFVVADWAFPW